MSKKKGGKGKARKTRANPDSLKQKNVAGEAGRIIGERLMKALATQRETPPVQNVEGITFTPDPNPLMTAIPPVKTLDVRTPDAQQIIWTLINEDQTNAEGFVCIEKTRSIPSRAYWTWYAKGSNLKVVAEYDFIKNEAHDGGYIIRIPNPFGGSTTGLKGTSHDAKSLAEALLSAADWESCWRRMMGNDTNAESWRDHARQ